MKPYTLTFLLLCFFLGAYSQTGYLKIGDISGEASNRAYNGWSTILHLEHNMARPASLAAGPSRARQRVEVGPVMIRKSIDKASPKIAEALTKGLNFDEATIHLIRPGDRGEQVYLEIQLSGVLVQSHQVLVNGPDSAQEEFTLDFEKITLTYTSFGTDGRPTGKVEYQYNRATGGR